MSLWSNFNQTNHSSRDRRYYDDEFMTKDLFDFSRSFFHPFSIFDELERRNRQLFNDPFFTGAWLTNEEQPQQQRLEQSTTPIVDNKKENQNTNQSSSNGNQNSGTMTVTNNDHHSNRNRYGSHSNWLVNPFSRLSQVSNHLVPSSISIDISESPNEYTIKASLPGVEKENIKVDCDTNRYGQHYLNISAERKNETKQENKDKRYVYSESSFGSVSRSFPLPDDADIEKGVTAKLENGELKLNVPRTEQKKQTSKQITIQ